VLDVKVGSGAFMRKIPDAQKLAKTMVELGNTAGVRTRALLTDMSAPLGKTVGNALEVRESVEVLAGGGPRDVVELTVALAREMLESAGVTGVDVAAALKDGRAMDKWRAMIQAQGGDPDATLPVAKEKTYIRAQRSGYITEMDALRVGYASWRLGAGRAFQGAPVMKTAGIEINKRVGEAIEAGEPLFTLHTDEPERFERAADMLDGAVSIDGNAAQSRESVILDRVH
jgi:thymidine phosphorylase